MKSQICRNIKNSGNATVQLFVFHMDGVTQTGFCWSVINEWGGVIKMASCYIIYYSWISPSHGCEAIRVLGRSLQRRIGKATFNTAFFLFLFLFWKICAKENDLQQLEA